LTNFKVGELDAVSNLLNNLELTVDEKNDLYGKIIHCHAFMLVLDSVDDYDSYMISEEDVTNVSDFAHSAFSTLARGLKWDAERYNFFVPALSTNYMLKVDDNVLVDASSEENFNNTLEALSEIAADADEEDV
jgi:hypothetical protein